MISLDVGENEENPPLFNSIGIDFVVVVDISMSMKSDGKLLSVQNSIIHLLTMLNENHHFGLIAFNHEVMIVSPLVACTNANKLKIENDLNNLQPSGSTNISGALLTATRMLLERGEEDRERISTVMFITDGLSNVGLSSEETLETIKRITLLSDCIFNTFGFGEEHDSKLLHGIALKTQGSYYYIRSSDELYSVF